MSDAGRQLIEVVHFADPWCWWSWGLEPVLQRLRAIYGDQIKVTYKMGGITDDISMWRKEYDVEQDDALKGWIRESNSITGLPVDPECYLKAKVRSTWPACIAVKAAELQGEESAVHFFRKLMEKNLLHGRNSSEEDVYLEAAEEVGLDAALMRRDITSGKARESFEADHKAMNVSFLTLTYSNNETGERANVENVFTARKHEESIEKLTEGKLSKRTPSTYWSISSRRRDSLQGRRRSLRSSLRQTKMRRDGLIRWLTIGLLRIVPSLLAEATGFSPPVRAKLS